MKVTITNFNGHDKVIIQREENDGPKFCSDSWFLSYVEMFQNIFGKAHCIAIGKDIKTEDTREQLLGDIKSVNNPDNIKYCDSLFDVSKKISAKLIPCLDELRGISIKVNNDFNAEEFAKSIKKYLPIYTEKILGNNKNKEKCDSPIAINIKCNDINSEELARVIKESLPEYIEDVIRRKQDNSDCKLELSIDSDCHKFKYNIPGTSKCIFGML